MVGQPEAARTPPEVITGEPLDRLIELIVQELHPEQIWLFGSRARGDAQSDSDYDLFVVVPDETPREKIGLANTSKLAREVPVSADVLAFRRHVFAEERDLIGTMSYTVAHEGVPIYGHRGFLPNMNSPPITAGGRKPTVKDVSVAG